MPPANADEVLRGALAIARQRLGMEVAHVSEFADGEQVLRVVDGDGDRFGFVEGDGTPLADTYCARMVAGEMANVVPDAAADPQARELPVTARHGIGAYVGVPVRGSSGRLFGSMCCVSHRADARLARRDVEFMHVLARLVGDHLERRELAERARAALERQVADRTAELQRAQAETVERLSRAVEFRDDDTGAHIERVGRMAAALAHHAGLDQRFCETIRQAAPLHDIGKVAAPDAVLLKPGVLSAEERAIIEAHPEVGHRLLDGSGSDVLRMAATIARTHHERYDGRGYPQGLRGDDIPVEGRIVAIVDVFDALTSDRVYRPALSLGDAVSLMQADVGHFDGELLERFVGSVLPHLEQLGVSVAGPPSRSLLPDGAGPRSP